jgi:hypothetical protein
MRWLARGSEEDGYRDRDTTIADDGEQEAGHVFLQILWTYALRKLFGRSKVQHLLLIRMVLDVKLDGSARLHAETPASIAPATFL